MGRVFVRVLLVIIHNNHDVGEMVISYHSVFRVFLFLVRFRSFTTMKWCFPIILCSLCSCSLFRSVLFRSLWLYTVFVFFIHSYRFLVWFYFYLPRNISRYSSVSQIPVSYPIPVEYAMIHHVTFPPKTQKKKLRKKKAFCSQKPELERCWSGKDVDESFGKLSILDNVNKATS